MNDLVRSGPNDETMDAQVPPDPLPRQNHIEFVQGSTPELSNETAELLRHRLRTATLILFAGFLAFFLLGLFQQPREMVLQSALFYDHLAMVLVTGLIAWKLCTNCPHVLKRLRLCELIVFGGSAQFFVLIAIQSVLWSSARGFIAPLAPGWIILIFTYALFIPNTVRRAGTVIGAMAIAPVVVLGWLALTSPDVAAVLQKTDFQGSILALAMIMTISAASALWGTHSIGSLRQKAFTARQFGQYRLTKPIGSGGMGDVFLAEHVLLKRPCAIKLIRPEKAGDLQALARFEREVQATAKLTHWNTIEIYDYGRADDGTFYYVMEYLPGLNLGQLVELHGALPAERVIHLLAQTCEALSEAHQQGLIHRDIKPANIFAAHRGNVFDVAKLLDFGLAKPTTNVTESALTMEGTITGSPLYMSPEQVTGDSSPDERSDIYSLGVTAYFLLTGQPPFLDDRPMKVMLAHARDEPVPPSRFRDDVPADLEQVVMRCLEKDPDHRYQSAEDLRRALLDSTAADRWTRDEAQAWWKSNGCPKKKALDDMVFHPPCLHAQPYATALTQ